MTKKKGEFTVLRNIRAGMVIILLIYIGLIFQSKGDSDTPFADVQKAVVDAADDKNMTLAGTQEIKRFYGINPKDYEDITLYYTNETMGVNELLLVKTKDENEAEAVEKAAEQRKRRRNRTLSQKRTGTARRCSCPLLRQSLKIPRRIPAPRPPAR